jgi:LAO/AO transport system kinase
MSPNKLDAGDGIRTAAQRLFAELRRGEARALGRAVSLVEDGAAGSAELLTLCRGVIAGQKKALRVGITGPAGAGKSTLVDALTRELRQQGRQVGIVAVDPSSPFSGGAILGDRIRLTDLVGDPGVYVRSMATRGHLGGLARATNDVLTVIEAALSEGTGKDVLLIETTGVGQGEVDVAGLADVVAVVLVPGMGDSIQSMKAGVLEIASVFVLNKADREGIERLEQEIGEMLALSAVVSGGHSSGKKTPEVLKTVATTGEGIEKLLEVLDSLAAEEEQISDDSVRAKALTYQPVSIESGLRPSVDGAVLDHLGIAVRSLADSQRLYATLGVSVSGIEEITQEQVRVAMLELGESRIELLEATEAESAVGRFIAKRGEGLHHVALRVPDLAAAVAGLKEQGVRLISGEIQVGAGGHRYVFVHPSSANGVLLELVEAANGGKAH